MLIDKGANVNNVNAHNPALIFAVIKNSPEMVKLLLAKGANPNAKEQGSGQTPLLFAVINSANGHNQANVTTIIRNLLAHGADPDLTNNNSVSARMLNADLMNR